MADENKKIDLSVYDELNPVKASSELDLSGYDDFNKGTPESALSYGAGDAFSKHAINGALLGGASKISGAMESPSGALKAAQQYTGYLPFIGEPASDSDPDVKKYLVAKMQKQQELKDLSKASPMMSGAGEMSGSLATGALLNPSGVIGAAGMGGGMGLINSDASSPQEAGKDFARGAVLGGTSHGLMSKAVPYAMKNAGNASKWALKKGLNTFADTPEKLTEGYLTNPEAYENAQSLPEIKQKIADTFGEVKGNTKNLADTARKTLSYQRGSGMPAQDAISALNQLDNPEAKALADKLQGDWSQRMSDVAVDPNAHMLSEAETHEVKKTLQGLGNWKSPLPQGQQAIANSQSGAINATLKTGNPEYAAAMSDLSNNMRSKQQLASKFGIEPDYSGANESGFKATDRTESALKNVVRKSDGDRAQLLQALKEHGHGDLADDIEKSLGKAYFEGQGTTNGSRRAVMGAAIGGGIGGYAAGAPGATVGATIGATVGGAVDKYAPQMAKGVLNGAVVVKKLANSTVAQKFMEPIQGAIKRGTLPATYFLLGQTEPDFRKAMEDPE